MIRGALLFFVVFGYLFSPGATGQARQWTGEIIGSTAQTVMDVKLRDRPPGKTFIFVQRPGGEVATLKKGERVEITGLTVISTLVGDNVWVEVKKKGSGGKAVSGWAYWGASKEKPVNFKLEKQE